MDKKAPLLDDNNETDSKMIIFNDDAPNDDSAQPNPHQNKDPNLVITQEKSKLEKIWDKVVPESLFGSHEGHVAVAWVIYTGVYWTISIWVPIIAARSFDDLGGFILWCVGFIGVLTVSYTIYKGQYPSGATKDDPRAVDGLGRYTTIIIVSAICIDVIILMFVATLWAAGATKSIDVGILIRLICHIIQLLWTSLFFFNKFYQFAKISAVQTFGAQWLDITYSAIIGYLLTKELLPSTNSYTSVRIIYFYFIVASIVGWMFPMIILKSWGASKYMKEVAIHCIVLDMLTDFPVLVTLLATGAYKGRVVLIIDLLAKCVFLIRSISFAIAHGALYAEEVVDVADNNDEAKIAFKSQWNSKVATFCWICGVAGYWSIMILIVSFTDINSTIAGQFEIYTWFFGMIGCGSIWYCLINGYAADVSNGPTKSVMGATCLIICIDWILRAFGALQWDRLTTLDIIASCCHSLAILTSMYFFYGYTLKKNNGNKYTMAWITLIVEYFDILFMFLVICILHFELYGRCFKQAMCSGYFVIITIKVLLWFFPIIFGYSETEKMIHIHMLGLDCCTDLPLVIIIILSKGYNVHPFVFFDISYKIFVILRAIAYHGIIKLLLGKLEDNQNKAIENNDNNNADNNNNSEATQMVEQNNNNVPVNAVPADEGDNNGNNQSGSSVNVTVNVST